MKWYNLIFITTFINLDKVEIFLRSLAYNQSLKLKVILVAQKGLTADIEKYQNEYTSISIIEVPTLLSLSKARNLGIDYVLVNEIKADYVMFPDDDSSFDSTFFTQFEEETKDNNPLIIDVYNENSKVRYIRHTLKHGSKLLCKHHYAVGSTNMVIPYKLFVSVGHFDELMGVGAKYGAGEDADYYIRIVQSGVLFLYDSNLYNFHPKVENKYKDLTFSQLLSRYKNYGMGAAYLYFKHKMYINSCLLCLKALVASLICLMKLDFKMMYVYFYAFMHRVKAVVRFTVYKK